MQQALSWTGRKILVTGGGGFLGSHLTRRLSEAGSEVHATSRQARADAGGIRWWQADLADLATARRLVTSIKPDTVYHLAGAVTANPAFELVLPTYHSHLTSTVNLLTALTDSGCRRIVVTGTLVEPPPGDPEPVPHSPYAAAKWAGVGYARMFHALYAVPVVIVRLFMTYGPAQAPDKIIPATTTSLLRGIPPKLSSGVWRADWAYVDDVIGGLVLAAAVPGVDGATFELGTGRLNSIRTMVETLVHVTGSTAAPIFGALPDRPGNSEIEIAANTGPAADRLGWRATTSIESGLRQTVEWHRARLKDCGRPALPG